MKRGAMILRDAVLVSNGTVSHTFREVCQIGYRNGQLGTAHYPPCVWGGANSSYLANEAYARAYNRGYRRYGHVYEYSKPMPIRKKEVAHDSE